MDGELLRLAAFAVRGRGGNPAGVWLGPALPPVAQMQQIAADVGYSETAFNVPTEGRNWQTRYYSPRAEVAFCGHATIATGVVLGERFGFGSFHLDTSVGDVAVAVHPDADGTVTATLTSVQPETRPLPDGLLATVLQALGWAPEALDPTIPAGLAYAGAWHVIVPVATRGRLAELDYDFERLLDVMLLHDLTTIQLVHRDADGIFHSRNPFPVGGVVEDPATGAAAAALGGYLRACDLVSPPVTLDIYQGYDMGRPSQLSVHVPVSDGVRVSGTAVAITRTMTSRSSW